MPARLHVAIQSVYASRPPFPNVNMSPYTAPCLHTSRPRCPVGIHASTPPDLQTSVPARLHVRTRVSVLPDLQTSIPARLHVGIYPFMPLDLQTSMPASPHVDIHVSMQEQVEVRGECLAVNDCLHTASMDPTDAAHLGSRAQQEEDAMLPFYTAPPPLWS